MKSEPNEGNIDLQQLAQAPKELVLGMNGKIQELERKNETRTTTTPRRGDVAVCYSCHRQSHFVQSIEKQLEPGTKQVIRARLEGGYEQNSGNPGILDGSREP
ncbi:hypothetical protein AWC38_SpisGene20733 [Stylophora pistillata]|uniref:Uncharacterized protein n=1 Tax=Stylophora pistillata TaxID=50429 RepID=A0A2B4RD24_STYPI|nr:hypothetical protein AWC38_SpisGene20733 [Stylophora pistillata]